jgi:hypothetical protein
MPEGKTRINRRDLLMGVAATAIAARVPAPEPIWSFSAFVYTGRWHHMLWSGDQFFLNGELAPPCVNSSGSSWTWRSERTMFLVR